MNTNLSFENNINQVLPEGSSASSIIKQNDNSVFNDNLNTDCDNPLKLNSNKQTFYITNSNFQVLTKESKDNSNLSYNNADYDKYDRKIKDLVGMLSNKKLDTVVNIRNSLLNWLKSGENKESEYNKFITEKKIRYMLKQKDKYSQKLKAIEIEVDMYQCKIEENEKKLGDLYCYYNYKELKEDISRMEIYELKGNKNPKIVEKYEEMKQKLPIVKEQSKLKYYYESKLNEKDTLEKFLSNTKSTLRSLICFYKQNK